MTLRFNKHESDILARAGVEAAEAAIKDYPTTECKLGEAWTKHTLVERYGKRFQVRHPRKGVTVGFSIWRTHERFEWIFMTEHMTLEFAIATAEYLTSLNGEV